MLLSMTGSRMEFYAKIIKIYHSKFILWNYAFIYDWIKDEMLLKIIISIPELFTQIYNKNLFIKRADPILVEYHFK